MSLDAAAQRRKSPPLITALAGGLAGLTSRFVIAPLDVIKIRLQLQTGTLTYRGALHAGKTILAQEGLTALWKGNIPAELLYVSYSMVQFVTYREAHVLLEQTHFPNRYRSFVAGASAGTCASLVTYPLDLLRTRFAAQGTDKVYLSMQHSVKEIYRHEGIKGYYRGAATSLLQIAPYMGLLFGTYEASRTHIMKTHNASPRVSDFVAGGIAGVVSKCAIFPLDTIRKRLQVQGPTREKYIHKDIPLYSGIIHTLTRILRQEGLKGLYKGLGIALVKSGPSAAVTLWVFEGSMRFWEWVNHRPGKGGTWHD